MSLDFFLPDYNLAIECQGEQHFKPMEYFGGEEEYEKRALLDKIKKSYCEENGIKLLYYSNLSYNEFLGKSVLHSTDEILNNLVR